MWRDSWFSALGACTYTRFVGRVCCRTNLVPLAVAPAAVSSEIEFVVAAPATERVIHTTVVPANLLSGAVAGGSHHVVPRPDEQRGRAHGRLADGIALLRLAIRVRREKERERERERERASQPARKTALQLQVH